MDFMLLANESPTWQLALSGVISLGAIFFVKTRYRPRSASTVCQYEQTIPTAIERLATVVKTTRHQDHGICWQTVPE